MGCRHQPDAQTVRRVNLAIDQVDWFRKRCPGANPNTQVKKKIVQEKERQHENLSSPMKPKSIFKNRLACVQVRPGVLAQTAARMNGDYLRQAPALPDRKSTRLNSSHQ